MSKSITFRLRFTLLIERDPLKHRKDVLRMANEIMVLIQHIVVESWLTGVPLVACDRLDIRVPCQL